MVIGRVGVENGGAACGEWRLNGAWWRVIGFGWQAVCLHGGMVLACCGGFSP